MVVYNLTNVTSANNIFEVLVALNEVTNPPLMMWNLALYSFGLIVFFGIIAMDQGKKVALLGASMATTFIGVLLLFTQMINFVSLAIPLLLSAVAIIILTLKGGD